MTEKEKIGATAKYFGTTPKKIMMILDEFKECPKCKGEGNRLFGLLTCDYCSGSGVIEK